MKTLIVGECAPDTRYEIVDPSEPYEVEFENDVARALSCYRLEYRCIPFRGSFVYDDRVYRADLALIAADFSHWFIIEVELVSHSLQRHVIPQVRAFGYGRWQPDCVTSIAVGLKIDRQRAETILTMLPRSVAVVANKRISEWEIALSTVETQLLVLTIFRGREGRRAYELDGDLQVVRESLGFGTYSAVDRAIRFPSSTSVPEGEVQIVEMGSGVSWWIARRSGPTLWLTRKVGLPDFVDRETLQVLRAHDGRTSLRRCSSIARVTAG
ncbi:MAG TPA: hypothetical protein VKB93_01620 [Thermoanaerobaculia bacterium]|nr:hypothetical protein [Thermoanaerobaculia bacterium]